MPKIYLSPSFQQQNVGVGDYGTEERRCNEIADVVERELKKNSNFIVVRNNPNMSLNEVIADSNKSNSDIHFSIHTNAGVNTARGCEVYAYAKGTEGDKLAQIVYRRLSAITPSEDRGVKYNSLAETRQTKATAVLTEVAFHSNEEDAKWMIDNIETIGKELAMSLYEYFNIEYKENIETIPQNDKSKEFEKYDKRIGEYQGLLNQLFNAGLKRDNWWGKDTASKTEKHVALKRGMKNELVRWLQKRLIELGFSCGRYGADGHYGTDKSHETENAVRRFQEKYGLPVDGIAGIQVIRKLVELF